MASTNVTKADFTALKVGEESRRFRGSIKEISLLRADSIRRMLSAIGFNILATAGLIIALVKVFGR